VISDKTDKTLEQLRWPAPILLSMAVMVEPRVLTVAQVANALQVSEATVYRRVAEGDLRAVRTGHGRFAGIRIPVAELERYLGSDVALDAASTQPPGGKEA
jgi:excisionase family DNA binding protein